MGFHRVKSVPLLVGAYKITLEENYLIPSSFSMLSKNSDLDSGNNPESR